jgi:hypothetical protein
MVESESDEPFDVECAVPLVKKREGDAWVVHAERAQTLTEGFKGGAVMLMTAFSLLLCFIFYAICPKCLFLVLIISACMCPWFQSMNAPLWLAIILLVLSGWTFTAGYLSVTWNSGLQ